MKTSTESRDEAVAVTLAPLLKNQEYGAEWVLRAIVDHVLPPVHLLPGDEPKWGEA